MRLSKDDRYELARAAIKADDLVSLRDYIISVVDAFDDRPEGKTEVPCPRYITPGGKPAANGHHQDTLLVVPELQPRVACFSWQRGVCYQTATRRFAKVLIGTCA